jgi:hypothetical protein
MVATLCLPYGIIIIKAMKNLGGKRVSSMYPKPEGMNYYRQLKLTRKDILCHATG